MRRCRQFGLTGRGRLGVGASGRSPLNGHPKGAGIGMPLEMCTDDSYKRDELVTRISDCLVSYGVGV